MSRDRRIARLALGGVVLLGGMSLPWGLANAHDDGGPVLVRVHEGAVSVKANNVSLDEVLGLISAQSGVRLLLHGARRERISAELASVPLEQALQRLIGEDFVLQFSPEAGGDVLEMWVAGPRGPATHPAVAASDGGRFSPSGEDSNQSRSSRAEADLSDARQRALAMQALGAAGDQAALDSIRRVLASDDDPDVRKSAIQALEDLGDRVGFTALAAAASSDADAWVRERALDTLVRMDRDRAVDPLARALREDVDPMVRYDALVHLGEIGGAPARGLIRQALRDPHELIWARAQEIMDAKQ